MIPLQLFGTIETEGDKASAMLCMDDDRPDEAMLHCWGGKSPATVLLSHCRYPRNEVLELQAAAIFLPNENGGIGAKHLPPDRRRNLHGLRATLQSVGDEILGDWVDDSGRRGRIVLRRPSHALEVRPEKCTNWSEFKDWASRSREERDAIAYRGHGSDQFRLRTSLHRAGRYRLERYCQETLLQFRDHAEAVLGMRFNLNDGDDYSILLGLAQHHGLPTPLLDWSASPYIAAFFAFSDALEFAELRPEASHVRVYGLTREFVRETSPLVVELPRVQPYVASLSISPRNNPRLYAQQGLFLVTNVVDVESFVCQMEQERGKPALMAADVPVECASEALEDLAFMGLTAATLYPGLDGVCRMMRHAMLFKRNAQLPIGKPSGGTG